MMLLRVLFTDIAGDHQSDALLTLHKQATQQNGHLPIGSGPKQSQLEDDEDKEAKTTETLTENKQNGTVATKSTYH